MMYSVGLQEAEISVKKVAANTNKEIVNVVLFQISTWRLVAVKVLLFSK